MNLLHSVTKVSTLLIAMLCLSPAQAEEITEQQKKWLTETFSRQHQELMPKVAVADMFYGCNRVRKSDAAILSVPVLVTKISKEALAEKLEYCLKEDKLNSDVALNFGLVGCFTDQLSDLTEKDRNDKMVLVENAIKRLSREERQKSFTKCVSEQAIKYIK